MTVRKLAPLTDADEARIQEGIRRDPDNPEWTKEDFANAKPFAEVFPELAGSIGRGREDRAAESPKQAVSLRLDRDVVAKFKATGEDWQSRINEVLRNAKV